MLARFRRLALLFADGPPSTALSGVFNRRQRLKGPWYGRCKQQIEDGSARRHEERQSAKNKVDPILAAEWRKDVVSRSDDTYSDACNRTCAREHQLNYGDELRKLSPTGRQDAVQDDRRCGEPEGRVELRSPPLRCVSQSTKTIAPATRTTHVVARASSPRIPIRRRTRLRCRSLAR